MSGEPKRLVEDPGVPLLLREDLRMAAEAVPAGFDVDAGLERLQATLSGAMVGPAATAASTSATGMAFNSWGMWGALAVVVAAIGATLGSWLVASDRSASTPSSLDVTAPPGSPDTPQALAPPSPAGGEAQDLLRREIALVAQARALLETQPAETLALLERARAEIHPGVLGEEREALMVLALHRLDRTAEARTRGQLFLRQHPESPFAERVRAAIRSPWREGSAR
jgi:hypothetical protein